MLRQTVQILGIAMLLGFGWAVAAPPEAAAEPAAIDFRIETSRTLSLLYFARAALGHRHTSRRLSAIYQEHGDAEDAAALKKVRAAFESAPSTVEFHASARNKPTGRRFSQGFHGILESRAGSSTDLDDFSGRITGLLPVAGHASLIEGLRGLRELHDEHVWKPSRTFLERSRRELIRIAKKADVEERFAQAGRFYGARWPETIPVTIYLIPVPGEVQQTSAHSSGANGFVEVVEGDDLQGRFAVLFHEMCHSLYSAQPMSLQSKLAAWFDEHPLPIAANAYGQLNEGLASAIGNGWVERALRGHDVLEESWYADEVIDTYAHALYPLVVHYLEEGRTIDRDFANRAVALFAWKFPDAGRTPPMMFRRTELIASADLDVRVLMKQFRREFDVRRLSGSQPISHERSRANYRKTNHPAVFVVTRDQLGEFDGYAFGEQAMERLGELFREHGAFVWVAQFGESRTRVFIGVPDTETATSAYQRILKEKRLDDGDVLTW